MQNEMVLIFFISFSLIAVIFYFLYKKKSKSERERKAYDIHKEKMNSLKTLCAGVAHEINNPLSYLIVNLKLLLSYLEQRQRLEEAPLILEECLNGAYRIRRVVQDFLLFSHCARGKKTLVDVNTLLDSVIRAVWNEIKHKADIIKDYKAKDKIWVDSTELGQVFLNIILNASEAIENGRGLIEISTFEDDENLYIKISDTGRGVDPKIIPKIFDPFFTTKGKTGLGLYVSRDIVRKYKGRIDVENRDRKGATFTVVLPKKEVSYEREL